MQDLKLRIKEKKVLFITTKNIDYIRNSQEIRLIKHAAKSIDMIYSDKQRYIYRIIEVWIKLLKFNVKSIDIVFIGFAPQLILPFFGWKIKNKTIIIDFFISVYDTLIHDRKKFRDKGVIAGICHWIDKVTLTKAGCVITDTTADAQYFINEFSCDAAKFKTLYLEADALIYYPQKQHKPDKLKDKFVVLYFGSILPLQGVDIVLDAISKLNNRKDIYFDIIGPIPDKYNKPIQCNIGYTNWLSQEELAEHIANADICLAGHFNINIEKAKRTIPGKAYIYAAMNKKMILGNNDANKEISLGEDNIFIDMGDANSLADAIIDCYQKHMHINKENYKKDARK